MDALPRIGIVGGNGWIGGALARALAETGAVSPDRLILSCRSAPPGWLPEAAWTRDNQALADAADVVVLSVRPQDWQAVRLAAPRKLVISVMAGIPVGALAEDTGTARVVRALPNAAAEVRRSYTPWTAAAAVTEADRATVRRLVAAIGSGDELADEAAIDYMTGLTGTGPAYPALLATALIRDAVGRGLAPEVARRAVVAMLVGTGRLFEKSSEDPEATVAAFVDYRGVTAAGIEAMRAAGFDAAVAAGLAAALATSLALAAPARS